MFFTHFPSNSQSKRQQTSKPTNQTERASHLGTIWRRKRSKDAFSQIWACFRSTLDWFQISFFHDFGMNCQQTFWYAISIFVALICVTLFLELSSKPRKPQTDMLPQISVHIRCDVLCYFCLPASNSQLATSPSFRPGGVRAARFNKQSTSL